MRLFLISLAALAFVQTASAAKPSFQFLNLVGTIHTAEGYEQLYVTAKSNGKISIHGSGMTDIEAAPVVIEDNRPTDGDLKLQVGAAVLTVGSGFNPEGLIGYSLTLAGQTVTISPNVQFNLK